MDDGLMFINNFVINKLVRKAKEVFLVNINNNNNNNENNNENNNTNNKSWDIIEDYLKIKNDKDKCIFLLVCDEKTSKEKLTNLRKVIVCKKRDYQNLQIETILDTILGIIDFKTGQSIDAAVNFEFAFNNDNNNCNKANHILAYLYAAMLWYHEHKCKSKSKSIK